LYAEEKQRSFTVKTTAESIVFAYVYWRVCICGQ